MNTPAPANLDVQGTANAFGYEWTTHGNLEKLYGQPQDVLREFATFMIPDDFLTGKRVLDAGCGMGRWSWCALQKGAAEVRGFDLHDGIECAKKLCASDLRAAQQEPDYLTRVAALATEVVTVADVQAACGELLTAPAAGLR